MMQFISYMLGYYTFPAQFSFSYSNDDALRTIGKNSNDDALRFASSSIVGLSPVK